MDRSKWGYVPAGSKSAPETSENGPEQMGVRISLVAVEHRTPIGNEPPSDQTTCGAGRGMPHTGDAGQKIPYSFGNSPKE